MSKTHLTFYLSESAFSIATLQDGVVELLDCIYFTGQREQQAKEAIQEVLVKHGIVGDNFKDISLSWFSPELSLMPIHIFTETKADAIYRSSFSKVINNNDIDYNRIVELSLVNVFDIPLWVKSFFVVRFPQIIIQHEMTHFLRGIFAGPTFKLNVYVQLYATKLTLTVVQNNELKFFNSFDITSAQDAVYYLLFVLQQQGLDSQGGKLHISESVERTESVKKEIISYLQRIEDFRHFTVIEEDYLEFKFQKTCV